MTRSKIPRIALVHDHLDQFGGGEEVLLALHELYPDAPIYTLVSDPERIQKKLPDADIRVSFIQRMPFGLRRFKWYLPLMPSAFEAFDLQEYDVVISDSSAFAKAVITSPDAVHIDYCHTPTRYLWTDHASYVRDLRVPRVVKSVLQWLSTYLRIVDRQAAARVDIMLANSRFVARRISKYYRREAQVVYPPVRTEDILPAESSEVGDYFLIVSRLRPYKRVDLAIAAFNRLGIPLKVVGGGEELERLSAMAKANIEFLGEVDNATRNHHLARCRALIYPQEEDFGISAVEAMAAGRPVIAYAAGGALESVVPRVTGLHFLEQTWEDLADQVIRFQQMEWDSVAIRAHAERFSKARFQSQVSTIVATAWKSRQAGGGS